MTTKAPSAWARVKLWFARRRKAFVASVIAGLGLVLEGFQVDGGMSEGRWVAAAIATLVAWLATYTVSNAPPDDETPP